ncbi:hypothetical protein M0R45_001028 [Rubus argutus]|uniref:Uncharacterized protein n=1 Tax=Rubus argutus TaxID=59490 RepID=A0AAW1VL96_RUBAR
MAPPPLLPPDAAVDALAFSPVGDHLTRAQPWPQPPLPKSMASFPPHRPVPFAPAPSPLPLPLPRATASPAAQSRNQHGPAAAKSRRKEELKKLNERKLLRKKREE